MDVEVSWAPERNNKANPALLNYWIPFIFLNVFIDYEAECK